MSHYHDFRKTALVSEIDRYLTGEILQSIVAIYINDFINNFFEEYLWFLILFNFDRSLKIQSCFIKISFSSS